MKNSDEILFPSCYLLLVALREDEPKDWIPFTLLDDLPLDPPQGSAIQTLVSGLLAVRITGPAHEVNSPIASRMDWLRTSNCFPFNLR